MKNCHLVSRLARRPFLAWCMGVASVVFLTTALAAGEKSIFDDDWTPPPRTGPATPAPANRPAPAAPAPASPVTVPKVTRPKESVPSPAIPPAARAPSGGSTSSPQAGSGQAGRRPLPAATEQAKSRKLMAEAFSRELADSSPSARLALAKTLLQEAAKMADAASDQFVVLGGAIQSAVEAADLPLAFEAADQLADRFDLDGLAVKVSAALKLPPKSYAANAANVPAGLELLNPLESADDFDAALRLVAVLEQVPVTDPSLHALVSRRAKETDELWVAREKLTAALEKLKLSPEDPAANLAVGRYTALLRGDWEHGLPFLARGDDPKLAALAKATLANPADSDSHVTLANGWWDLALASSGRAATNLLQRAAEEYQIAEPGLGGLELALAKKRAEEADAAVAAAGRSAGAVHLLSLIDDQDLERAHWSRQGPAVVSNSHDAACLTVPYLPPDEYDFSAEVSRLTGNDDIVLAFPVGEATCNFVIGVAGNRQAALAKIGGKWVGDNPTLTDVTIANNERHRLEVKVRRDGVGGYLDGKRLCYWRTDGSDLYGNRSYMPRSPGLLAIGSWKSEVAIYSLDLTPLNGSGAIARERDADRWIYNPRALRPSAAGAIQLSARDATVHGSQMTLDSDGDPRNVCFEYWRSVDEYVTWFVDAPKPGDYAVEVAYSCSEGNDGSEVQCGLGAVTAGVTPLTLRVEDTGGWWQFRAESLGELHLPAGRQMLWIKAKSKPHGAVMNLQKVVLTPAR
jgi:hypothetical protein